MIGLGYCVWLVLRLGPSARQLGTPANMLQQLIDEVRSLQLEREELKSQLSANGSGKPAMPAPDSRPVATPVRKGIEEDAKHEDGTQHPKAEEGTKHPKAEEGTAEEGTKHPKAEGTKHPQAEEGTKHPKPEGTKHPNPEEGTKHPCPEEGSKPALALPAPSSSVGGHQIAAATPSGEGGDKDGEKLMPDGLPARVNSTTHRNAWAKMASCLRVRSCLELAALPAFIISLIVSPSQSRAYETGKFEKFPNMLALQEGTLQVPWPNL